MALSCRRTNMLDRLSNTIPAVAVSHTAIGSSEEIIYGGYAGGMVFVPTVAGVDITVLTWYAAEKPGGTYLPAYDSTGTAVTQTVSHTKAYPIPAALAGCRAIKAMGDASGSIAVSLKG